LLPHSPITPESGIIGVAGSSAFLCLLHSEKTTMEKYQCTKCDEWHDDWPAYGFNSPDYHYWLSEEEKEKAELSEDFCIVREPDGTRYFIRAVLIQPVKDRCETLDYGVWTSLGEQNFLDYRENFKNPSHQAQYLGWLANKLPDYHNGDIKLQVVTGEGSERPLVFPHQSQNHPLVHDFYRSISLEEAERRIVKMLGK
jgi:hypothetical protein